MSSTKRPQNDENSYMFKDMSTPVLKHPWQKEDIRELGTTVKFYSDFYEDCSDFYGGLYGWPQYV